MAVPESLTGQFASGKRKIEVPKQRVPANPEKVLADRRARQQPEGCNAHPASGPVYLHHRRLRLG